MDVEHDVGSRQRQEVVGALQVTRVVTEALAAEVGLLEAPLLDERAGGPVEHEDALAQELWQPRRALEATGVRGRIEGGRARGVRIGRRRRDHDDPHLLSNPALAPCPREDEWAGCRAFSEPGLSSAPDRHRPVPSGSAMIRQDSRSSVRRTVGLPVEPWSSLPLLARADVVVLGSGSAGSTAAIASARTGASTLLIEKLPFLGGNSTAVLDTFYGFYTPGSRSIKVVGGIADEVVAGLRELGPVVERPNTYGAGTGVTYHPEHLKVVWERLVRDSGARILLHAFLQDARVDDGRVHEALVATKGGLARVAADVFVDASGDADLCHHAGFGYETAGEIDPAQTLTTTFRMANVDRERRRRIRAADVHALMAEAAASGEYDLPRREGSDHITPIDGVTATIMTRVPSYRDSPDGIVNVSDPWFLTEAEMAGRRQALEYARFLVDRVPGYERRVARRAVDPDRDPRDPARVRRRRGSRATTSSGRDRSTTRSALCGAPIEDHHPGADTRWHYLPDGAVVGIPYRTLLVRDAANVLVAGRCFSATHDAHASVRSMAQCMAMGQAAGTAAAMAARAGVDPRGIDPAVLRERLASDGAVLSLAERCAGRVRASRMTFVRTVLGDIDPAELGVTYAHEHLIITGGKPVEMSADFLLDDVDKAVEELAAALVASACGPSSTRCRPTAAATSSSSWR